MNIRATIRRRRGGDRVIKVSESGGTRSRRRPARLLKDSGRTQPELRIPGAAAQTRVVCVAGIRLGSGESARAFKGIICDDISEFESYMPVDVKEQDQQIGQLPEIAGAGLYKIAHQRFSARSRGVLPLSII